MKTALSTNKISEESFVIAQKALGCDRMTGYNIMKLLLNIRISFTNN